MLLAQALPDEFRNHSSIKIDDDIFPDAIIPMTFGVVLNRKDISVEFVKEIEFEGKSVTLLSKV